MQEPRFLPLPTETVRALRAGGPDANGMTAERAVSDGAGNPCRHCLCFIPEGAEMLILAYRPFDSLHPYAETGPIFLCAGECQPWSGPGVPPPRKPGLSAERLYRRSAHPLWHGQGGSQG